MGPIKATNWAFRNLLSLASAADIPQHRASHTHTHTHLGCLSLSLSLTLGQAIKNQRSSTGYYCDWHVNDTWSRYPGFSTKRIRVNRLLWRSRCLSVDNSQLRHVCGFKTHMCFRVWFRLPSRCLQKTHLHAFWVLMRSYAIRWEAERSCVFHYLGFSNQLAVAEIKQHRILPSNSAIINPAHLGEQKGSAHL